MISTTVKVNNPRKAAKCILAILMATMFVLLTGCSTKDNADLHEMLSTIKAKPAGKIPPLPVFVPYETFMYGAKKDKKDDPFKGFGGDAVAEKTDDIPEGSPRGDRNLETLEQYPLDTLRYVGQLTKDGSEWAIVTSPDMIVHRVKVGNHLGSNYGEIVEIAEDKISISETIPDELGGWIKREAALSLLE